MDALLPASSTLAASLYRLLRLLAWGTGSFTALFAPAAALAARRFRRRRPPVPPRGWAPAVTVLKPIKGTDAEMAENLASFLRQDHPRFQVLFCLQSPEDPALTLLHRLRRDFPEVDADIIISKNRIGYNPKVNNLSNAYGFAKHDILVISDSDVRVPPDFLRRATAPLANPAVGLATCFYRSSGARGIGTQLEALSVNAHFLPQALVAVFWCRLRFAMGAAMAVRRSAFEAAGGLAALGAHLADDFVLGRIIAAAGFGVEFSEVVVDSVPDCATIAQQFAHQVRWSRTIRACNPAGYLGAILVHGGPWVLLYSFVGGGWAAFAAFAALEAWRAANLAWLHRELGEARRVRLAAALAWLPLSDLLQLGAWIAGLRSSTVLWRGETYAVRSGGRLVPRRRRVAAMGATAT